MSCGINLLGGFFFYLWIKDFTNLIFLILIKNCFLIGLYCFLMDIILNMIYFLINISSIFDIIFPWRRIIGIKNTLIYISILLLNIIISHFILKKKSIYNFDYFNDKNF